MTVSEFLMADGTCERPTQKFQRQKTPCVKRKGKCSAGDQHRGIIAVTPPRPCHIRTSQVSTPPEEPEASVAEVSTKTASPKAGASSLSPPVSPLKEAKAGRDERMTKPKQEEIKPALRQAQTGPVVPKAGAASLLPAIVTIQSAQEKDIPNLAGLHNDSIWKERRQVEAEPESVLWMRQHWRNTRLRHERSQRIHTFGASSPRTRSEDDILFTKEAVVPRAGSSPIEARSLATAGCLTMVRQSSLFCALHRHTRLVAAQQRLALAMRLLSKNIELRPKR